jgi:hypothetical protein
MIANEQDRTVQRDAFGMKAFDAAEIKSERQPDDPAHQ